MRPCRFSHALICAAVSRKSASALRLGAAIDDAGRRDEMLDRQRVDRIVRQVAPGNPVNWRVEMRAGVLAEADIIPVPGRAAIVVAGDFLHAERAALAHFRRQHDRRKIRRQCLRQIDKAERRQTRRRRPAAPPDRSVSLWVSTFRRRFFRDLSSPALFKLAFERFRIVEMPRQPVLRHVARIDVLDRASQCLNHGRSERRGRKFRRHFQLVPFIVDRAGKEVDHAHAGRAQFGAQRLRQRVSGCLRRPNRCRAADNWRAQRSTAD